jgi:hypothetical protein
MSKTSSWKASGRKQEKSQSNASARARQKHKQLQQLRKKLKGS